MNQVSTIGLDLAKNVVQIHGAEPGARRSSINNCVGPTCCAFSKSFRRVWSAWRRAAVPIGRARLRRSVTTCA